MIRTILLVVAIVSVVGCQVPLRPYRQAPNPVTIDAAEYNRVFAAAVDVLRDRGFEVGRQDYRFGAITTEPRPSPTIGEPWDAQNTTLSQAVESTLNHVRRQVTVTLEPVPGPADETPTDRPIEAYLLRVEVVTENQQLPSRRLTMAAQGARYSNLASVPQEWRERGIRGNYWVATGRDPHLEERLIRAIVKRSLELPQDPFSTEPIASR